MRRPVGIAMQSLPDGFRALIIGASGAIGAALVDELRNRPGCALVVALHRHSQPAIDFSDEASIAAAAAEVADQGPFQLIINATGILHASSILHGSDQTSAAPLMPEKRLADVHYAQMQQVFLINTFGPALVLRHFSGLLDRQRGILALLSAKVGSIGDNRLGGWYSYRASKAALNMLVKTAAIELKRSQPNALLLALHPGTVNSRLSQPFRGGEIGRSPAAAAQDLLRVLDQHSAEASGRFLSYSGEQLPW
jgi:NAD(P)-dependent dehydrogenase (short-subunit alcohol dehydrogenase family)